MTRPPITRELHGLSKHPIYSTWKNMISRCYTTSSSFFHLYGGRGIRVCEHWYRFKNFYDDMIATWQPWLSLDRINPDGNYEPNNCRWATFRTQTHNRRRNLKVLFRGDMMALSEVAEIHSKVDYPTLYHRVKTGWNLEDALAQGPLKECRRKPFVLNGTEYKTLRGAAKLLGLTTTQVKKLILKGEGNYL